MPSLRSHRTPRRGRPLNVVPRVEPLEARHLLATFSVAADHADGAAGSLRATISVANSNDEDDEIILAAGSYLIELSQTDEDNNASGDFDITEANRSLHIRGAGRDKTTIDARSLDRTFDVFERSHLILSDLTVTGGRVAGSGGAIRGQSATLELVDAVITASFASEHGGGIYSLRTNPAVRPATELRNSSVTFNRADVSGGGIHSDNGDLAIYDAQVSDNVSDGNGGGIINHGLLDVQRSVICSNAAAFGGGIYNQFADAVTVSDSGINDNMATEYGGGIANRSHAGFTVTNSTVSGNSARRGAGIDLDNATLTVRSSTVSHNTAGAGVAAWDGHGGGVWNSNATLEMENSTISHNEAALFGGGLRNGFSSDISFLNVTVAANQSDTGGGVYSTSGDAIQITNSIIAGNSAGSSAPDVAGSFATGGHNLIGINSANGFSDGANDILGSSASPVDARLGPLADHGGPTATHPLLLGSPAIDAGDNASAPALDQRGIARPQNGSADIGAYEFVGGNSAPIAADDGPYAVSRGTLLTIAADRGVLANDQDPDISDSLTARVVRTPDAGTLTLFEDGAFEYVHDGGLGRSDSFEYEVVDDLGAVDRGTATILIVDPVAARASADGSLEYLRQVMDQYHTRYVVYEDVSSAGNHFHTWAELRHPDIVDDGDSGFSQSGSWVPSPAADAFRGDALETTTPGDTATFEAGLAVPGTYEVSAWWGGTNADGSPRELDAAARFVVIHKDGEEIKIIDQNGKPGQWVTLGFYDFAADSEAVVRLFRDSTGTGATVADAIRFVSTARNVEVSGAWSDDPHSGATAIRAELLAAGASSGGFYHQIGLLNGRSPIENFGDRAEAGVDLSGATRLTFWARGEKGNEQVEFFVAGVGRDPQTGIPQEQFPGSSPRIPESVQVSQLTTEWQEFTIDLAGHDLSYVLGGFGWFADRVKNPNGAVFYLDDIVFELDTQAQQRRLAEPRFLRSFTTLDVQPNLEDGNVLDDLDFVLRNLAFSYDNALAMLAFLADDNPASMADSRQRASLIADAFVHAANNDRFFDDGRIRTAYSAGDYKLPPGWLAEGKRDTAPVPGFFLEKKTGCKPEDPLGGLGVFCEVEQEKSDVGNHSWVMIAMLELYKQTGKSKYLETAEGIGEFILQFKQTSGEYQGFLGGVEQPETSPTPFPWTSTEHNLDVYAGMTTLYEITSDSRWLEAAEHAKAFVDAMWCDADCHGTTVENVFLTGTQNSETLNKSVLPLDPQSWSSLAIPSTLSDYPVVLDNAIRYLGTSHSTYTGFDFNSDLDGVWFEGTAQMAVALRAGGQPGMAEFYLRELRRAQADPALAPPVDATFAVGGGIPAADRDGVTTGFAGFLLYRRDHIAVAAWNVFAQLGHNPFYSAPVGPKLIMVLPKTQLVENEFMTVTVTRDNTPLTDALDVAISNGDASELALPAAVRIEAGQSSATFQVRAIDDFASDGNQTVFFSVTASGHLGFGLSLHVADDPIRWQNPNNRLNVNGDAEGLVLPVDVLAAINWVNANGTGPVSPLPAGPPPFADVNGDNFITPVDILIVINYLNAQSEGESEAPVQRRPVTLPLSLKRIGPLASAGRRAAGEHLATRPGQSAGARTIASGASSWSDAPLELGSRHDLALRELHRKIAPPCRAIHCLVVGPRGRGQDLELAADEFWALW